MSNLEPADAEASDLTAEELFQSTIIGDVTMGEDHQGKGADGAARIRRWLTLTTRVSQLWEPSVPYMKRWLVFPWPFGGKTFSFDFGGVLQAGDVDKEVFLAESKNYSHESGGLAEEFRKFLAQCYVVTKMQGSVACENFFWISFSPFQAKSWDKHTSPEAIQKALLSTENIERVFNTTDLDVAKGSLDPVLLEKVSRKIWLITVHDRIEDLSMLEEHYHHLQTTISAAARQI